MELLKWKQFLTIIEEFKNKNERNLDSKSFKKLSIYLKSTNRNLKDSKTMKFFWFQTMFSNDDVRIIFQFK